MEKLCNGLLELQQKADATLPAAEKDITVASGDRGGGGANSTSRGGWGDFALGGNSTATNSANHNPVRLSKQPFGSSQDIMKSKINNDGVEGQDKATSIGSHDNIRSEDGDYNSDSDSDNYYSDTHVGVPPQSAISQGLFCDCTLW